MRRRLFWFWCVLMVSVGTAQAASDVKIGVIDTRQVMEQAPQAQSARSRIEQEFRQRREDLQQRQQDLKSRSEKFARDGAIMTEEQRKQTEKELITVQRELKRDGDAFREDLQIRSNEELARIQNEVRGAIEKIAAEAGYDLILSLETVPYASKRVDVTAQVIKRLQEQMGQQRKSPN